MNTDLEKQPPPRPPELEIIPPEVVPTKLDDTAAILERRVQQEVENRRTERFYWIFAVTMLIEACILPHISWFGVPVFLMALVFLIAMAKSSGIDSVVVLLQRLFDKYIAAPPKQNDE